MILYPEAPIARVWRIAADTAVLLWFVVWVRIGVRVHDLVGELARPGRSIEEAGTAITGVADGAADRVGDLPLVGGRIAELFTDLGSGGAHLSAAGVSEQQVAHDLAMVLGVVIAVIPIAWLASRYLPARMRWVRDATAASRLRLNEDGLRLFALRALITLPLPALRAVSADPVGDYDRGDYERLAAAELRRLGLVTRPLPS